MPSEPRSAARCPECKTPMERDQPWKPVSSSLMYGAMVGYLRERGWRREEPGSGWWWHPDFDEATVGDAVEQQMLADGIDTREVVLLEPEEFYGTA